MIAANSRNTNSTKTASYMAGSSRFTQTAGLKYAAPTKTAKEKASVRSGMSAAHSTKVAYTKTTILNPSVSGDYVTLP
jgi:hypothetical protein